MLSHSSLSIAALIFVDRFNTLGKWKFHFLRELTFSQHRDKMEPPAQSAIVELGRVLDHDLSWRSSFPQGMKFPFPEGVEAIYRLRSSFPRLRRLPNFRLERTMLRRGTQPSWHLRIRCLRASRAPVNDNTTTADQRGGIGDEGARLGGLHVGASSSST